MKQRCFNPNNKSYIRYGGRGIVTCEQWRDNPQLFYEWALSNGYTHGLSIDRIDNNGNYEPNNCRWVDKYTQGNNKRDTLHFVYKNKSYTIRDLSNKSNISVGTLYQRLVVWGWDIDTALHRQVKNCPRKISKSGHRNIYPEKVGYVVSFKRKGKYIFVGYRKSIEDAILLRDKWLQGSRS